MVDDATEAWGRQRSQYPSDPGNPFLADYPSMLLVAGPIQLGVAEKMLVTLTCANGTLSAYVTAEQLASWGAQLTRASQALGGVMPVESKLIVPGH